MSLNGASAFQSTKEVMTSANDAIKMTPKMSQFFMLSPSSVHMPISLLLFVSSCLPAFFPHRSLLYQCSNSNTIVVSGSFCTEIGGKARINSSPYDFVSMRRSNTINTPLS